MVGAYVSTFSIFQMALAVVFGVLAYFLRRAGYPTVTLLLGFLLEADLEQYLRRSLSLNDGDPSILLTSPDSLFFLVLTAVFFWRSEEHTSELQSLMSNSYAVFCLKKKHTKTR